MQTDETICKKLWVVMILLALLVAFLFQGSRGLYETTEGRYAECAREMVETGSYLEPTLDYQPHWSKPPLTYWAIAGGIKLLGTNEWGVRFYNAIAFFLAVVAVASIAKTLWGKHAGLIAGFIYATSPFSAIAASVVSTDTLLTLWEMLAVLCYLKAYKCSSQRRQSKWIIGMWLCFGLGFFTKGPPALLPLLPILVWHLKNKRQVKLAHPLGLVLFILVGFSWYAIVCFRHSGLLLYFLGQEVVGRITSNTFHRNQEWYHPFLFFLPVLIFGAGPWLYFGLKTLLRERLYKPSQIWNILCKGTNGFFLLLWLLIPLVIFSMAKSRLQLYVLPLYAPLALATARGMCKIAEEKNIVARVAALALVTGLVLIGGKGLYVYYPSHRNMRSLYEMCKMSASNDISVIAFENARLYGLQFYLNGKLERVSDTADEPSAREILKEKLRKIMNSSSSLSYVFITKKQDEPQLQKALESAHLSFRCRESALWVVSSIGKRT